MERLDLEWSHLRNIILHYHIFKNAGTSIDYLLTNSLGDRAGSIEGPHPWSIVTADQVQRFLLERPRLLALSSHQARLPVPTDPSWSILPIVMLRHPIDRIASMYRFERVQGGVSPGSRMAEKSSLADYCRWRIGESGGPVARNFQTICLSPAQLEVEDPRAARPTERHLRSAEDFLESLPVFGLVEEFDKSMGWFRRWLQPLIPGLELIPASKNVSQESGSSLESRVRQMRAEIGEPLYQAVMENNTLDLELYEFAEALFRASSR